MIVCQFYVCIVCQSVVEQTFVIRLLYFRKLFVPLKFFF
ncbi:hypothetical protein M072_3478 [Bacteroides fragilis str. DS-208]|nr:hypothetical protein M072_3478 [Bacteroides fragilis str. DS-208]